MSLESDLEFYAQIKQDLLATAPDQWALIHNGELVEVYPTYEEAFAAATAQFGTDQVLIKQIVAEEKVERI